MKRPILDRYIPLGCASVALTAFALGAMTITEFATGRIKTPDAVANFLEQMTRNWHLTERDSRSEVSAFGTKTPQAPHP